MKENKLDKKEKIIRKSGNFDMLSTEYHMSKDQYGQGKTIVHYSKEERYIVKI